MRMSIEFFAYGKNASEVYSDIKKRWQNMTDGKYGEFPTNSEIKIRNNNDTAGASDDLVALVTARVKVDD
jgi:hypothetical protein